MKKIIIFTLKMKYGLLDVSLMTMIKMRKIMKDTIANGSCVIDMKDTTSHNYDKALRTRNHTIASNHIQHKRLQM
jgi:hypothetical protein